MLVEVKESRVFARLRDAARLYRDFDIRKRCRMIFDDVYVKSVFKLIAVYVFERRFFRKREKGCRQKKESKHGAFKNSHTFSMP